jgi:hypothetical protein
MKDCLLCYFEHPCLIMMTVADQLVEEIVFYQKASLNKNY